MWSETLHTDMNTDNEVTTNGVTRQWYGEGTFDSTNLVSGKTDQFRWSGLANTEGSNKYDYSILVDEYQTKGKVNDCNEVPAKYLYLFPACNACAGLNYAGFAEGWRLPSQRQTSHDIMTDCKATCGRTYEDQPYCALGRQLWDFGMENCDWDPNRCTENPSQNACNKNVDRTIKWDRNAYNGPYWASTQSSTNLAWSVRFNNAIVSGETKSTKYFNVRCFLGQWP